MPKHSQNQYSSAGNPEASITYCHTVVVIKLLNCGERLAISTHAGRKKSSYACRHLSGIEMVHRTRVVEVKGHCDVTIDSGRPWKVSVKVNYVSKELWRTEADGASSEPHIQGGESRPEHQR